MLDHGAEIAIGFVGDKTGRGQQARMWIGLAKAEPVIGDDGPSGAPRQSLGKITPQRCAPKRVVQQNDGRICRMGRVGRPTAREELTS